MRRLNLHNLTFSVGFNDVSDDDGLVLSSPPYHRDVYVKDPPYIIGNDGRAGLEGRILETLAECFNFSYTLTNLNGSFGQIQSDGTYSGLVGMVATQKLDFGYGGLRITYQRAEIVDFLRYHTIDSLTYATSVAVGTTNQIDLYLLLRPLPSEIWLLLFGFIVLFVVASRYLPKCATTGGGRLQPAKIRNTDQIGWIAVYLMFRQSYRGLSAGLRPPIKLVVAIWLFAVLILANLYGAGLYGSLAFPAQQAIDTMGKFTQAVQQGRLVPLCAQDTSLVDIFSRSKHRSFQTIWKHTELVSSDYQGTMMLVESQRRAGQPGGQFKPYALVSGRNALRWLRLATDYRSVYMSRKSAASFFPIMIAMAVRKRFRHRKQFDQIIISLSEAGLLDLWLRQQLRAIFFRYNLQHMPNEDEISVAAAAAAAQTGAAGAGDGRGGQNNKSSAKFTILHLQSVFYFYLASLAAAMVALAVEHCYHRKRMLKTLARMANAGRCGWRQVARIRTRLMAATAQRRRTAGRPKTAKPPSPAPPSTLNFLGIPSARVSMPKTL